MMVVVGLAFVRTVVLVVGILVMLVVVGMVVTVVGVFGTEYMMMFGRMEIAEWVIMVSPIPTIVLLLGILEPIYI
jgi:hypothetical protein